MDEYRYNLDGWDILLFALGLAVGYAAGVPLLHSGAAAGGIGFALGLGALRARRALGVAGAQPSFDRFPKVPRRLLVAAILIGIGFTLALFGFLAGIIFYSMSVRVPSLPMFPKLIGSTAVGTLGCIIALLGFRLRRAR